MRKQISKADAEAIRAEVDSRRGYPRVHHVGDGELVHVGGGRHVEAVVTTTAVVIEGDGPEVAVIVDDADEKHIEPTRRARLRAAKEPVEDSRSPEDRNPKIKR